MYVVRSITLVSLAGSQVFGQPIWVGGRLFYGQVLQPAGVVDVGVQLSIDGVHFAGEINYRLSNSTSSLNPNWIRPFVDADGLAPREYIVQLAIFSEGLSR